MGCHCECGGQDVTSSEREKAECSAGRSHAGLWQESNSAEATASIKSLSREVAWLISGEQEGERG